MAKMRQDYYIPNCLKRPKLAEIVKMLENYKSVKTAKIGKIGNIIKL